MKAELWVPVLVLLAIVTVVLLVAAVSGPKRYADDNNGPVWNDDENDWGSY